MRRHGHARRLHVLPRHGQEGQGGGVERMLGQPHGDHRIFQRRARDRHRPQVARHQDLDVARQQRDAGTGLDQPEGRRQHRRVMGHPRIHVGHARQLPADRAPDVGVRIDMDERQRLQVGGHSTTTRCASGWSLRTNRAIRSTNSGSVASSECFCPMSDPKPRSASCERIREIICSAVLSSSSVASAGCCWEKRLSNGGSSAAAVEMAYRQHHAPFPKLGLRPEALDRFIDQPERANGRVDHPQAGVGHADAAAAHDQGLAEFEFHALDQMADRGLRELQALRRQGEAARLGDGRRGPVAAAGRSLQRPSLA